MLYCTDFIGLSACAVEMGNLDRIGQKRSITVSEMMTALSHRKGSTTHE